MAEVGLTWAKDKRKLGRNKDLKKSSNKLKIDITKQLKKLNKSAGRNLYKKSLNF